MVFGLLTKALVLGIVGLFVLLTLGCVAIAMMPPSTPTPTVQATVAPTATVKATATPVPTATPKPTATPAPTATPKPTATPAPTATPPLSSFYGLLVEHPASVSGDDQSGKINEERTSIHQLAEPFHRATIDGRDVYIGKIVTDSGQTQKIYLFPLGSYDEARAAQAAYVKQFEAKGFTKVDEQTSNANERSFILLQYPLTSGTIGIDALSPLYYNVGYTMSVSIPQASS